MLRSMPLQLSQSRTELKICSYIFILCYSLLTSQHGRVVKASDSKSDGFALAGSNPAVDATPPNPNVTFSLNFSHFVMLSSGFVAIPPLVYCTLSY